MLTEDITVPFFEALLPTLRFRAMTREQREWYESNDRAERIADAEDLRVFLSRGVYTVDNESGYLVEFRRTEDGSTFSREVL